jgi:putative SbcD/Mre11-related phosphoesterase
MQRSVELAPGRIAHASGALWLPGEGVALLADVHLGYGWAQRRRGQLGPVYDGGARQRLESVLAELHPETVVFLGDIVHAPKPAPMERELVEETLHSAASQTKLIVVRGNHDRAFDRDYAHLGIVVAECWHGSGITAVHGDRPVECPPNRHLAIGHLHPALSVRDDAGASQRIPAFLVSEKATVLPAFSPFAAGFSVNSHIPAEVRRVLGKGEVGVVVATGNRVVSLGSLSELRRRAG